jgi:hypothetical protein
VKSKIASATRSFGLVVLLCLVTSRAWAYTECTVALTKVYAGDDGYVWLNYSNSGSAYVPPGDPDVKGTLALATAALMSGRSITVRYAANGVSCNAVNRGDVSGIFLQ